MKISIRVRELLHEGALTGRHSGRLLRESVIVPLVKDDGCTVEMDFSGIDLITQSAADEFIGRVIRQHSDLIERISFSNCARDVAEMLQWAADHANSAAISEGAAVAA